MMDEDDILELPLTPDELSNINDARDILTDYLIRLEAGEILSIAIVVELRNGTFGRSWTPSLRRNELALMMIRLGIERMGFTQVDDVQDQITKAWGDKGIDI